MRIPTRKDDLAALATRRQRCVLLTSERSCAFSPQPPLHCLGIAHALVSRPDHPPEADQLAMPRQAKLPHQRAGSLGMRRGCTIYRRAPKASKTRRRPIPRLGCAGQQPRRRDAGARTAGCAIIRQHEGACGRRISHALAGGLQRAVKRADMPAVENRRQFIRRGVVRCRPIRKELPPGTRGFGNAHSIPTALGGFAFSTSPTQEPRHLETGPTTCL